MNWKEQPFLFEFSKNFIKEAYTGYKQKGKREFERAKSIKLIFTQSYEARLIHDSKIGHKKKIYHYSLYVMDK